VPTSEPGGAPACALLAHAGYACRDSGVCCSSNWEIAVEDALHARIGAALAARAVLPAHGHVAPLIARAGLPPGYASVLGRADGRCVFHGSAPAACRLHAWGGPSAKPVACRQFPWIAVHDPRGTSVSLSHVCPTAAGLLHDPALLVLAPLPGPVARFEGLDVRRALPPAVSDRRLLDWDALTAWETQALDACARAAAPEAVARDLRGLVAHAARWSPGGEPLARWIAAWAPASASNPPWRPDPALDRAVRAAVPEWLAAPSTPFHDHRPEMPVWDATGVLVRRYLAARLVACWPLHFGTGLATVVAYVEALLTVVAGEIARRVTPATPLDDAVARAAIAETDRLVLHLAAPDVLARGLDAWVQAHAGDL
jgi:Fe-S-cluster containining protein